MGIFSDNAPKYWAAGLPVIPIHPFNAPVKSAGKRPAVNEWQQLSHRMPTDEEQRDWLNYMPDGNMGLVCGPCAGIVGFDVDTKDEKLLSLIDSLVPNKGPWRRVGSKGYVLAFKYNGEKTFQIKDAEGGVICELLSVSRQFILPPSIHPVTERPYVATSDLLEVLSQIPALPDDFERMLRGALTDKGVKLTISGHSKLTEMVPKSGRDTACTSQAGLFASDVMRGYRTAAEALSMLRDWAESYTEKATGDNLDPDEAVSKLIKFIVRDVREHGRALPVGWDKGLSEEAQLELGLVFAEDEKEWPYQRVLDKLREELAIANNEEMKHTAIEETLQAIKRSPGITEIQTESLLKTLSQIPGLKTPLPALRKRLATLKNRGLAGENHSDIAQHMKDDLKERLEVRFFEGHFYEWSGSHWREKDKNELKRHIMTNYSGLPVAKRDSDYKAILDSFCTLVSAPLTEGFKGYGINFANGLLTDHLELLSHNPKFGRRHILPYCYCPDKAGEEHAPIFHEFLRTAWAGDTDAEDKKKALQEAICVTMFGMAPRYQRVILLHGVGGTGKSALLRVIEGLLPPELVSAATPNQWDDRFIPAQMVGKLLNIGGELHEKNKIDGQIFKQVVVGDAITVQHKNQDPFKLSTSCAHWFASNHLPQSDDMSSGFLRRWLILNFNNEYPEAKRNINLPEDILASEREAIVAWAVEAVDRLDKNNCYTIPASHNEVIERMLVSMDTVFSFIRQSPQIVKTPSLTTVGKTGASNYVGTSLQPMYEAYLNFTAGGGVRPVGRARFLQQMQQHAKTMGFQVVTKTLENGSPDVGFCGLTLRGVGARMG
ncbi:phage/plasmid primase, P4 family [Telmatospirillum sp.]|uniref:phage/plasmid primase, P4 family n=1 Tax=Telmatospirillum sp. TaxID=2079197 RepID=UPI00284D3480|nr:phage/plasmid primase, P4 family [Telmatospirillum sp.]MDR3436421.1 phage/plasmid primase, P4 family [Telmatospirillum sp.]